MVCSVRWSVPAWRYCPDAFAVTRGGYLERRDAAGREFPVQNRDPDLRHAVRPFVSPAHLSLLGHAVAEWQKKSVYGLACRQFSAFI
jgi:hypothetical protein